MLSHYRFENHILSSAIFYKIKEDRRSDETEVYIILTIYHGLTETDFNNIGVKPQLEHQFQFQETKESDWIFDKFISMEIRFHKTGELIGSIYVKIPLRSNAILSIEKIDKYCFLWSILASLHPCKNDHPSRGKNYRQCFNELNIEGFDFINGFKCRDMHRFEKLNI